MALYVIDIETNGLISTKIHVMSVGWKKEDGTWGIKSTDDPEIMKDIMSNPDNIVIGHFFKLFDAVELERVLGFKVEARVIDTLALAWYIFPSRTTGTFGLGAFGQEYGIPKPVIEDWENLTYEDYKNRCEEDVKINIALWEDISERLLELYESKKRADAFIKYLMFKMDCLVEQQRIMTLIDIEKVHENIALLTPMLEAREKMLMEAMPHGGVDKSRPAKMYKKDKSVSALGSKWFEYLKEKGLPLTTEVVYKEANPSSTSQVKEWLFSLGWEPELFNDGANGPVPQIRNKDKELCPSILKLVDKDPAIDALDGLTVINHRLGVLNSFLDTTDDEGYCIAGAAGFTNTLRLRHSKPIVNLPGVSGNLADYIHERWSDELGTSELSEEQWADIRRDGLSSSPDALRDGQIIRECVIAPEGYVLCGSDISSLEDSTKRHYMYDYDPDYVIEQMEEGFDPHLDLAVRAGVLTEEQCQAHKDGTENHKAVRDMYKVANYSCIYGVGPTKLGKTIGESIKTAKGIIQSYWDRNWAIKQLPSDIETKIVRDQMWLLNPVSQFWYSVRSDRDIFSTLNQGTGAFVFDIWLKYMMNEGVIPFIQYHDEMVALVEEGKEGEAKEIVEEAMVKVNNLLKLNVEIRVDVQFGNNYAEVH